MKASIIIRAYNAQATIKKALASALNQQFSANEFEVVVVNDGSFDRTSVILRAALKNAPCLRVVEQNRKGAVRSANRGFISARGKYVVLLDDDDYFEPYLLAELSDVLDKNSRYCFAYSDYYEEFGDKKKVITPANIFETIAGGVMFRKDKLAEEGFYREGIFFAEYDLLLRTIERWRGMYCPKTLFTYSRRRESMTGNSGRVADAIAQLRALHPDKLNDVMKIRPYSIQDKVTLKRASNSDLMFYFSLRNEPGVRAQSFRSEPLDPSRHRKWFFAKLKDPDSHLFTVLAEGKAVGQTRLDKKGNRGEINIALLPEFRGKGYASLIISELSKFAFENIPDLDMIVARIKPGNMASIKSFARAGFRAGRVGSYGGQECIKMRLRKQIWRDKKF